MDRRITQFIAWGRRRRQWADSTCANYQQRTRSWLAWCEQAGVRDTRANSQDVQAWLDTLHPSAGVHTSARTALLAWYDWRCDTGKCTRNPVRQIDRMRVRRGIPRALPPDVVRAILSAAHDAGPRKHCYVGLLFWAGLRRHEACKVQWSDIEGKDAWLRVLGKGRQERVLPIHDELRRLLVRHRTANPSPQWLFPGRDGPICVATGTNWARTIFDAAGVTEATPHQARHSWATAMLRNGWDVATVGEALGHRDLKSVATYTRAEPARVAQAVASLDW